MSSPLQLSPHNDLRDLTARVGEARYAIDAHDAALEAIDARAASASTPPLEPYTGRFRSLVSSAPLLALWSAPPAPTGFTSSPPAARGLPGWWSKAVRGGLALTLALMGVKVALLAGLLHW